MYHTDVKYSFILYYILFSIFHTLQLVRQYQVAALLVLMWPQHNANGNLLHRALNQPVELANKPMDLVATAVVSCAGWSVVARDVVVKNRFILFRWQLLYANILKDRLFKLYLYTKSYVYTNLFHVCICHWSTLNYHYFIIIQYVMPFFCCLWYISRMPDWHPWGFFSTGKKKKWLPQVST